MSEKAIHEPIATRRQAVWSVLNRLVNLAGFWMAVFSLAGVVMLTVAGPIIEERLSRQVIPTSAESQPAPVAIGKPVDGMNASEASSQNARRYSLDGIRGTLAAFFVVGVVWASVSVLKSKRLKTP